MQEYLSLGNMNIRQAKALFKFRVRMAPFGDNYRGGEGTPVCPMCGVHPDTQEESFSCTEMRKVVNVQAMYSEVFGKYFRKELVETVEKIYWVREELRKL